MAAGSTLLLEEYFGTADDRFLPEVLACASSGKLKGLGEKWFRDPRPFAREALLAYVDDGCDRPFHRGLVKRVFKLAEAAGDDELMGHFLVALDRISKRELRKVQGWDWRTRTATTTWELRAEKGGYPAVTGDRDTKSPRFSRVTRGYLRRRAFRYFRTIGRTDRERYGRTIRAALALYRDEHLAKPENILDAWGLVHALYWASPVVDRDQRAVRLVEGRTLAELEPAPIYPDAFRGRVEELFALVANAQSRTVRTWAIAWLKREEANALRGLELARLRTLLKCPHEEVQAFAAELLRNATGVERVPLAEWLELLRLDNPLALPIIAELVAKLVSPARVTLAQCVELACLRPAPVAELGLRWTREKPIRDANDLRTVFALANAGNPRVRGEACAWLGSMLSKHEAAKPEHLRDLFDSRHEDARRPALALLCEDARFRDELSLWAALAESPYADAREAFVKHLEARTKAFSPAALRNVWATSLLALNRGGRDKRRVVSQVAERIVREPAEADALLPLLAIALRSVRAPERRVAIAALARSASGSPAIAQAIAKALPELRIHEGVTA